jgi:hypothetical protein
LAVHCSPGRVDSHHPERYFQGLAAYNDGAAHFSKTLRRSNNVIRFPGQVNYDKRPILRRRELKRVCWVATCDRYTRIRYGRAGKGRDSDRNRPMGFLRDDLELEYAAEAYAQLRFSLQPVFYFDFAESVLSSAARGGQLLDCICGLPAHCDARWFCPWHTLNLQNAAFDLARMAKRLFNSFGTGTDGLDTPEEARQKADELHAGGFEAWRVHVMSYMERVERAPEPPPSGSAGPATAPKSERIRRFGSDLDLLLGSFGQAKVGLLTTSVVVQGKTLLVIEPGSRLNEAVRILEEIQRRRAAG